MNNAQLVVSLLALVGAVAGCGTDQLVLADAVIDAAVVRDDANEKPIIVYAPDASGGQPAADAMQGQDAAADSTVADAGDGSIDGGDGSMDSADGFDGFACDPTKSPHDDRCVVDEAFGVFVAPTTSGGSDTSGDGSRAKPYATIAHALASLGGKHRVYVCDDTYVEAVTIQTPTSLYAGFVCPGGDAGAPWSYEAGGSARVITFPNMPNQVPLTLTGVDAGISIEDMWFSAVFATRQDDAGNGLSSIAAFVSASNVTFRRCTLSAGAGISGVNGTQGTNYVATTAPNGQSNNGGIGGAGGSIVCNDGTSSTGGGGGSTTGAGAGAGNGVAQPMPAVSAPLDGIAGTFTNVGCISADPGANGAAGAAAPMASTIGTLTASGWTPVHGGDGHAGNPGQGGGGGGGAPSNLGAAGGGAGGCGGAAGTGGGGGGSSIALACIGSTVMLEGCALASSMAGNGGSGGDGQPGQGGGAPGVGGSCPPGYGGNGAGGAGGTGGTGGISICVVYQGTAPSGPRTCAPARGGQPGAAGRGGGGGDNSPTQGHPGAGGANGANGLNGTAGAILQVP